MVFLTIEPKEEQFLTIFESSTPDDEEITKTQTMLDITNGNELRMIYRKSDLLLLKSVIQILKINVILDMVKMDFTYNTPSFTREACLIVLEKN